MAVGETVILGFIPPVDHTNVPAPPIEAVSVGLQSGQRHSLAGIKAIVGNGFTVTVAASVAVQPFASVKFTVKVALGKAGENATV